jgi:hypothetical protein
MCKCAEYEYARHYYLVIVPGSYQQVGSWHLALADGLLTPPPCLFSLSAADGLPSCARKQSHTSAVLQVLLPVLFTLGDRQARSEHNADAMPHTHLTDDGHEHAGLAWLRQCRDRGLVPCLGTVHPTAALLSKG